ncbi:hypothetical protein BDZ94DRAFT_1295499 [Collybia nuda]|uniref:Uncharacterized protein n=1 Tax=Collybia nuda TaxID=64659 RepID=A0A9P5YD57_9AGAR|nr:hypothetical protein BDZ94DRAFT_1295499 [Collybia nuda]
MAFNAQSTISAIPTSITQAIDFLTRPLVLIHTPTKVASLQLILQSILTATYLPTPQNNHPRMTFILSPASLPPRPIYAACIASGVQWSEWISVLGGTPFELVIDSSFVSVRAGDKTASVWQAPASLRAASSIQASLRATVNSALARAKSRTLAQQLLESDHEDEEAEEIFTMISKTTMVSPTPTRGSFHITLPVSPPSPDSSRPSSRSSNVSGFSFSSSEESMSSMSSASSMASAKAAFLAADHIRVQPKPKVALRRERTPSVFVDNTKKEVTKYSYEGGVSTVLTGGVMLGGKAPSPKPIKPIVARPVWTSPRRMQPSNTTTMTADKNNNWRRTTRV